MAERRPGLLATGTVFALWVATAYARDSHGQVDAPADMRRVPRGRGWWCYAASSLPNGTPGQRCVRQRQACARAVDAVQPALCVQQPRAFCVTYTARDYSTGRPLEGILCVESARVCEVQRGALYSTTGRDPLVSACTEAR